MYFLIRHFIFYLQKSAPFFLAVAWHMRLIHVFTSSRGHSFACICTGGFMENIRLFYAPYEHHAFESILSMAQGHIVHLLLVFFPFSSPSDVILSFSCRACGSLFLYFVFTSWCAYKSIAWCLSSRQVLGLLVNEINDLYERDFDENYNMYMIQLEL